MALDGITLHFIKEYEKRMYRYEDKRYFYGDYIMTLF